MSQSGVSNPVNYSAIPTLADGAEAAAYSDRTLSQFIVVATTTMGVVGAGLVVCPYMFAMRQGARVSVSPVQKKANRIVPSQLVTVTWREQLVWVSPQSSEMLKRSNHDLRIQDLFDPDTLELGVDHAAA